FNIIGNRFRFFLISVVVILIGIVSLASFGLKAGIEFSGGSLLTLSFDEKVELAELKQELDNLGYANAIVQTTSGGDFLTRTFELTPSEKTQLKNELAARFGSFTEKGFVDISPETAIQTARIAAIAVAIAAIGIMLYVTWAFRRMPKPFRYGTCAIVALLHDALVALGVFSILGGVLGWEVNLMFIASSLLLAGFGIWFVISGILTVV
ncbi:unnamed protein product, partial [marine sediment metagenome]